MNFDAYIKRINSCTKPSLQTSYSDDFRQEFISRGFEIFLHVTAEEEKQLRFTTSKLRRQVKKNPPPNYVMKINSLICNIKDKYPMITSYCYEPRKKYYIANEIAKLADVKIELGTLYEDDTSINFIVGFDHGKEIEFSALCKAVFPFNFIKGMTGFRIYNINVGDISKFCFYDGTHLISKDDPTIFSKGVVPNLCGESVGRLEPFKIARTRDIIEQIMSHGDFDNEIDLMFDLRDYIMKPLQEIYNDSKPLDYLGSHSPDKENILAYYNDVYSKLVSESKIPRKWKSETEMFRLISTVFSDALFQYYAKWIVPQSYDVYVPSLKTAFEYQGMQHYEAIDFFGGEDALKRRMELDIRKRILSEENGIELIEWKYDESITKKRLLEKIKKINEKQS